MNRDYSTGKSDKVEFFTGYEVEHTPAYGLHTLFVVGCKPPAKVLKKAEKEGVEHIYLGANQSFVIDHIDAYDEMIAWDNLITTLLIADYWVTLDFDHGFYKHVQETPGLEYNKFIPMISVKMPYLNLMPYHTHVKIDDTDFKATNPGVWVHRLHSLKDPNRFTDWDRYKNDTPIIGDTKNG